LPASSENYGKDPPSVLRRRGFEGPRQTRENEQKQRFRFLEFALRHAEAQVDLESLK
jgi:hypothetical protein